jgi:hypothetical protein
LSTEIDTDRLAMMDEANTYWQTLREKVPSDHGQFSAYGHDEGQYTPTTYGLILDKDGHFSHIDQSIPRRDDLVVEYAWAIPSPEALRWILERLGGQGIIEMGAGTGYWSALLTLGGADVVAFDEYPPDQTENWFHTPREEYLATVSQQDVDDYNKRWGALDQTNQELVELTKDSENPFPRIPLPEGPQVGDTQKRMRPIPGHRRTIFFPVQRGSFEKLTEHRNRALLLSWPPYDDSFAYEVLEAFPGDTLFYIGEGDGGCTGDDAFFHLLYEDWEEVDYCRDHISWSGIRDHLTMYRRKS